MINLTLKEIEFLGRVLETWSPSTHSRRLTKDEERLAQAILDKLEELDPS